MRIAGKCASTIMIVGLLAGCQTMNSGPGAVDSTPQGQFVRSWLVCGPFPNPPHQGAKTYDHTPPCPGFAVDYLTEHGGETNIVPYASMSHRTPDGGEVTWFAHSPEKNIVDLSELFKDQPTVNVLAYAFGNIKASRDGDCLLALGSDDGIRVWVNGELVHDILASRGTREDNDVVAVSLKKGNNRVMVKVEQGDGGWGFVLRSLNPNEVLSEFALDDDRPRISVSLRGSSEVTGKRVDISNRGTVLAHTTMRAIEGAPSVGSLDLPYPGVESSYDKLRISVDGQPSGTIQVPDLARDIANVFKWHVPRGYPGVFSGETLPTVDYEHPLWIEQIVGRYSISVTYYDSAYNEVHTAEKPGRYGAVANIATAAGTTRRFVTLFRQPERIEWWRHKLDADISLPAALGIPEETMSANRESINDHLKWALADNLARNPRAAAFLAGLYEASQDGSRPDHFNSAEMRDRKWWLGLKRKIYGFDRKYPDPFVCPRKISGTPAGVVREGSLRDAGMKGDFPRKLDSHLTKWAADSDEAFAVCVVRNGVIAFHKAYGTRDGKPMTVTTKSWMASTTKMLSGSLIMMLVDQKLLALEDRADKYLPPLRAPGCDFPATILNLYTHTAGMDGHWGAGANDMEERVAGMASHYDVGGGFHYDGAGLNLACKILEGISGETLPEFFRNHLLRPLGCDNTTVYDAGGGTDSIPLDMARISQMLLQKGAYGDMSFFSDDTFKQMLPRDISEIARRPTTLKYGIGTSWFTRDGLGEGTFAHNAASSTIVRIDPENNLVIVMTRNRAGMNFSKYYAGFFETIVDGLVK